MRLHRIATPFLLLFAAQACRVPAPHVTHVVTVEQQIVALEGREWLVDAFGIDDDLTNPQPQCWPPSLQQWMAAAATGQIKTSGPAEWVIGPPAGAGCGIRQSLLLEPGTRSAASPHYQILPSDAVTPTLAHRCVHPQALHREQLTIGVREATLQATRDANTRAIAHLRRGDAVTAALFVDGPWAYVETNAASAHCAGRLQTVAGWIPSSALTKQPSDPNATAEPSAEPEAPQARRGLPSPLLDKHHVTGIWGVIAGDRLGVEPARVPLRQAAWLVMSNGEKRKAEVTSSFELNLGCNEQTPAVAYGVQDLHLMAPLLLFGDDAAAVATHWFPADKATHGSTPLGAISIEHQPPRPCADAPTPGPRSVAALVARPSGSLTLLKRTYYCSDNENSNRIDLYLGTLQLSDGQQKELWSFFKVSGVDYYSAVIAVPLPEQGPLDEARVTAFLVGGC